jgi:type I restriction enzyme S subunit
VPDGWTWVRIDDVCLSPVTKRPSGKAFRYIDIDAIDNKRHCITVPKNIVVADAPSRAAREVKHGDTLFSMVRPYLENIGLVTEDLDDCIASTGFYVCRPNNALLLPKFLYHFLVSSYAINGLNRYMRGDNSPSIRANELEQFPFPLPPLAEQKRIVAVIEPTFDVIDEIEKNKADLLSAITAAKSKILSLAIRGKLVPQDPNDEPASVLLERIRKEREKLIKQGKIKRGKAEKAVIRCGDNCYYTWLPESWEVCCLDDVLDYEQPTAYIVENTNYNGSYQTPVLTAGKSFIIGYTNETEGICDNLPVIIFDDFTTDSHYVDFKFKVKSSAMKILRNNIADLKYLFCFMQTIESNHTTHKRYWISDYSQKIVALPPLAEQRRIVAAIKTAFEQFDSITTTLA